MSTTLDDVIQTTEEVVGVTIGTLAALYGIPGVGNALDKLFSSLRGAAVEPSKLQKILESAADEIERADVSRRFQVTDGSDK